MNGILKKPDTVSVIILNHNGGRFIEDCIKSVLSADYSDKEVIVVDDHSEDGSVKIIEGYHKKVKLIHNKGKMGFAPSVNTGIRHSRGEIIVLLNMDTLVDKEWLSGLVNAIISDERVGIVGSKILFPDWKTIQYAGGYLDKSGISHHIGIGEIDEGQYNISREVEYVCGASMGIKRVVIKDIGYFDEGYSPLYYEDVDFARRVIEKGYKVMYIPWSKVSHHENSSVGKYSSEFYHFYHKNRLRFVIKNYSLKEIIFDFIPEERMWLKERKKYDKFFKFFLDSVPEEKRWLRITNRLEYQAALKAYLLGIGCFPWLRVRRCLWKLNLI